MRHPARWVALGIGVLVASFAIVLATQVGGDPRSDATSSRLLGERAPTLALPTLDGDIVDDAAVAGKAVVVNFWNSWCIPCHEELPALREFYERHAFDPDFAMVGILRDDTAKAARAYASSQGMEWTLARDPDAAAALAFGTRGQPETFAISPGGVIVGSQFGPASVRDLEQMLSAARGTSS